MTFTPNADEQFLLDCAQKGEQGIADYGVKMFKQSLVCYLDKLYQWSPLLKLWKPARSGVAQQSFVDKLEADVKALLGKIDPKQLEDAFKSLSRMLSTLYQINKQNAIWRKVESQMGQMDRRLNGYDDVLPLRGGKKVNLRTGEITERTPEDLWSYETAATGFECTPEEKEAHDNCYRNFAKDAKGVVDEELYKYFRALCAYSSTFQTCNKSFTVLKGDTNTGKSFFFSRLKSVLQERVGGCVPEVFIDTGREEGHKTYYQDLEGKSAVCISELQDGARVNSAQMKRLTGDDIIRYRICHGTTMRELIMTANIFILTNYNVGMDGGDDAMVNRFQQIPFRFVQKSRGAKEDAKMLRLLNSQGGINATMAWIVEGTKEMFKKIDEGEPFLILPEIAQAASQGIAEQNDIFMQFLTDECEVWTPETGVDRKSFTYERQLCKNAYTNYHRNAMGSKVKVDQSTFLSRMQSRFGNGKATGAWEGIRMKVVNGI